MSWFKRQKPAPPTVAPPSVQPPPAAAPSDQPRLRTLTFSYEQLPSLEHYYAMWKAAAIKESDARREWDDLVSAFRPILDVMRRATRAIAERRSIYAENVDEQLLHALLDQAGPIVSVVTARSAAGLSLTDSRASDDMERLHWASVHFLEAVISALKATKGAATFDVPAALEPYAGIWFTSGIAYRDEQARKGHAGEVGQ